MITILTDLIYQALAKGYERQNLRIQFSESLHDYLTKKNHFVVLKKEEEGSPTITSRQFMGVHTECYPGLTGMGFMLWHHQPNPNKEIHPYYTALLGVYSNLLGLPIK